MTVTKIMGYVEKDEAECPLRAVGRVVKSSYKKRPKKDVIKAIVIEIFSNFSLKG